MMCEVAGHDHILVCCKDLVGEPHHVDWGVVFKVIDVRCRYRLDCLSFQERHFCSVCVIVAMRVLLDWRSVIERASPGVISKRKRDVGRSKRRRVLSLVLGALWLGYS